MPHFPSTVKPGQICRAGGAILLLIGSGCVGPISDPIGANFRAKWISSRAALTRPYDDYTYSPAGRNQFIEDFVAVKNLEFHNYVTALRRGSSYGNLGIDGSRLVLDGLAATTGGAEAKAALAAASFGVSGFSNSFKKDVLFDQALPSFVATMETLRANKLADISLKLTQPLETYSFATAFNDVEDYGAAGTFDAALHSIEAKAGQDNGHAKTALAVARNNPVTAAASAAPQGGLDPAVAAMMKRHIDAHKLPPSRAALNKSPAAPNPATPLPSPAPTQPALGPSTGSIDGGGNEPVTIVPHPTH